MQMCGYLLAPATIFTAMNLWTYAEFLLEGHSPFAAVVIPKDDAVMSCAAAWTRDRRTIVVRRTDVSRLLPAAAAPSGRD
jgi:hypothetical protein